ncbi:hypothetical protein M426DRAFT_27018 [Hypoxylon sp. CI-4A]|nr:hypothetical protein M426DRAFT_27018 [Hypoxylon sp. CI-4A]
MSESHNKSIADFELYRVTDLEKPIWFDIIKGCAELEAMANGADDWSHYKITTGLQAISKYSVSISTGAYFVGNINLSRESRPAPVMKHRDMMVDNFKAAGGDLATLRKIGIGFIINEPAFNCIARAFAARKEPFPDAKCTAINLVQYLFPCQISLINSVPGSTGWLELVTDNPFINGQQKMLREYASEFNGARIKSITAVANGKPDMIDINLLYLITHLTYSPPPSPNPTHNKRALDDTETDGGLPQKPDGYDLIKYPAWLSIKKKDQGV